MKRTMIIAMVIMALGCASFAQQQTNPLLQGLVYTQGQGAYLSYPGINVYATAIAKASSIEGIRAINAQFGVTENIDGSFSFPNIEAAKIATPVEIKHTIRLAIMDSMAIIQAKMVDGNIDQCRYGRNVLMWLAITIYGVDNLGM